jgi:hypothetical protein
MTVGDKVRTWVGACHTTKVLLLQGIRLRNASLSARDANLELLTLLHGKQTVQRVLGTQPEWRPSPLTEEIQAILDFVKILDALDIDYHIGGSFASVISGEPRQTRNVDVIVRFPSQRAGQFVQQVSQDFDLPTTREHIAAVARSGGSFAALHRVSGFEMDVIMSDGSPFDEEEFKGCLRVPLGEPPVQVPVKSARHIILRKLLWFQAGGGVSERQWRDVAGVMRVNWDGLDVSYMRKWAIELGVADLFEQLVEQVGRSFDRPDPPVA